MTERKIANRIENQSLQKAGGPLWTRTRDPSLIRTEDNTQSTSLSIGKLSDHIIAWYNEQKLKGITEITLYGYRQKVQALLDVHSRPQEFDVKEFLTKKQKDGCLSGTIANYIKAYRSFFGYLFTNSLYDLDYHCLRKSIRT